MSNQEFDDGSYAVTIPVSKQTFGKFLGDLIAVKRSLKYRHSAGVVVDRELLINLDCLLRERVLGQNNGDLIQVSVTAGFSDGRNYTENSVQEVLNIAPLGKAITDYINITYVFAVVFPGAEVPTRHSVEIAASNGIPRFGRYRSPETFRVAMDEYFEVSISYSERSWAEDIISLFKRALESARRPEDVVKFGPTFLRFVEDENFIVPASFSILGVYAYASYEIIRRSSADTLSSISDSDIRGVLVRISADLSPLAILAPVVVFIAVGSLLIFLFAKSCALLGRTSRVPPVIFDLYTSDAKVLKEMKASQKKILMVHIGSFLLAVIAGVFASYIFKFLD